MVMEAPCSLESQWFFESKSYGGLKEAGQRSTGAS